MAFLTKVFVFDADDMPGIVMVVPVYDSASEVLEEVKRSNNAAGMNGVHAAILCYVDNKGAYRGEMRVKGETRAVCDVDSFDALATWLEGHAHHCEG